jgi:phosphate transport system protein
MSIARMEELVRRDLSDIKRQLRLMADLVLRSIDDALRALQTRDRRLAYTVILADNRIDALEGRIDRLCQEFLVRHMPVAGQLRFVMSATKVNSEMERIGDYADAIARRTVALAGDDTIPVPATMFAMCTAAAQMLRQAIRAFVEGDVALAEQVLEDEGAVDEMNRALFDELAHPTRGEQDLTVRFALLGVLNRIERIADRACNIAEEAIYAEKGESLRHVPRHGLRVLFVSPADASLGPMAEAIAQRRAPLHVSFASAGMDPRPLDERMMAFMAQRGFEITRPKPRGLADIGALDDYYVIVTLNREAAEACPPLPYRTVQIAWDLPDPSRATGTPAEVDAVYTKVYEELDAKIGDLLGALLGTPPEES